MERAFFYPNELHTQIWTQQALLNYDYFEQFPKPKIDLKNPQEIHNSLKNFVENFPLFELDTYIKGFLRPAANLPDGLFGLDLPETRNLDHNVDHFHLITGDFNAGIWREGHESLVLKFTPQDSNTMFLAVSGLICSQELPEYYNGPKPLGRFPTIVQLQGISKTTYFTDSNHEFYSKALNVLQSVRWNRVLTNLVVDWAIEENIPAVYLLPSSMNPSLFQSQTRNERLFRIYDLAARESKFQMQPNGLYGISLLGFTDFSFPQPNGSLESSQSSQHTDSFAT